MTPAAKLWNRSGECPLLAEISRSVSPILNDLRIDFCFTTAEMNEESMGARFDFETLAADRNLRNKVFDAVDIHGDWLRLQTSIFEITKQIDARLIAQ
jgi:hypothetical protein